jgi:regulator of sirC expression with transglutaminase-like and TPR domain
MSSPFAGNVEFQKLLAGQTKIDLPQLMLEFATDAYPKLDGSVCLAELDRLGRLAAKELARLPDSSSLELRLAAVSQVLYEAQGFHGNDEQYYDPRNSYLNEVLERRLGIPISLGIVYMAVAARVGLPVEGVCTPGHFVLT